MQPRLTRTVGYKVILMQAFQLKRLYLDFRSMVAAGQAVHQGPMVMDNTSHVRAHLRELGKAAYLITAISLPITSTKTALSVTGMTRRKYLIYTMPLQKRLLAMTIQNPLRIKLITLNQEASAAACSGSCHPTATLVRNIAAAARSCWTCWLSN